MHSAFLSLKFNGVLINLVTEFNQALQSDSCRLQQLQCHTSTPDHPFNRFFWGIYESPHAFNCFYFMFIIIIIIFLYYYCFPLFMNGKCFSHLKKGIRRVCLMQWRKESICGNRF